MTLTELKAKATELGLTPDDVRQHGNLSKKATWEAAIDAIGRQSETVEIMPEKSDDIAVTVNQSSRSGWWHKTKKTSTSEDGVGIDGELVPASEVVNSDNLPTLAETDPRFEAWQPWMLPGATFTTGNQSYTILYFDPWGNCNAKGTDDRWHSFRIETIVNTATDDFVQKQLPPSEPIPPIQPDETVDMEGWQRWDEKLKIWVKENPDQALEDCYQPESDSLRSQLLKRIQPYVGNCVSPQDFEQLQNESLDETTAAVYLGLLEGSERILAGAKT